MKSHGKPLQVDDHPIKVESSMKIPFESHFPMVFPWFSRRELPHEVPPGRISGLGGRLSTPPGQRGKPPGAGQVFWGETCGFREGKPGKMMKNDGE